MIFTLERSGKVFTSFDNISLDFNTKVWDPHWKLLCMTIECENQTKPDIQIFSCWGKTFSLAFPILHVIHAAKTAILAIFTDLSCL